MKISATVKALLSLAEKKQSDLAPILDMGSKQSLSNKFSHDRWSANDLVEVAKFCGCRLAFILPNGQEIIIDNTDQKETSPDE